MGHLICELLLNKKFHPPSIPGIISVKKDSQMQTFVKVVYAFFKKESYFSPKFEILSTITVSKKFFLQIKYISRKP